MAKASKNPRKQSPTKGKGNSPPGKDKTKGKIPTRTSHLNNAKMGLALRAYGFPELVGYELYSYEVDAHNDAYSRGLELYLTNPQEGVTHKEVDAANFTQVVTRRTQGSDNEVTRNGKNNFFRKMLVRYVPEGVSSPESRKIGLEALKSFFMDPRFSKPPPP